MRIDYSSSGLQLSENLDDLLEGLLEPLVEDRLSAEDALALLSDKPARRPLARQALHLCVQALGHCMVIWHGQSSVSV